MKVLLKRDDQILTSFTVESLITVEIILSTSEASFLSGGNPGIEEPLLHCGNDKKIKSSATNNTVSMEMLCFTSNYVQIRKSPGQCNPKCRSKREGKPYGIQQGSIDYDEEKRKLKMEIICFCIPKHVQKSSRFAKLRFILRSADREIYFESEFVRIGSNRGKERRSKKSQDPSDNNEITKDLNDNNDYHHFNGQVPPSPTTNSSNDDESQLFDESSEQCTDASTNSPNSNQYFSELYSNSLAEFLIEQCTDASTNSLNSNQSFDGNSQMVADFHPETFLFQNSEQGIGDFNSPNDNLHLANFPFDGSIDNSLLESFDDLFFNTLDSYHFAKDFSN